MTAQATNDPFRSEAARERYLAHYDSWARDWPVPCETRSIRTSFGETFVRVSGDPDSPPLVLVPGGRAPSLCWMPIVPELATEHRVFALDAIYDVGRSTAARPLLNPADVTEWLDGVLNELGLQRVRLMGLSMGAWAVAEYSIAHPQRVEKSVWLSPAGIVAPISGGFIARGLLSAFTGRWGLTSFLEWIMPDAARTDGEAHEFYERMLEDLLVSSASFKNRPFPGGPREFSDEELGRIDVPVLYVIGDRERVCPDPARAVERARSLVTGVEPVVLTGGGHDVSILRPHDTAQLINDFLRS